jgi:adenylosuccinate synthase
LANRIVLVSGQISSGKTTLCKALVERFGFISFRTRDWITELASQIEAERRAFQDYGNFLDRKTRGAWIRDALARSLASLPEDSNIVIDAVRIPEQIDRLREAYGRRVLHIHLEAPLTVLARRFKRRQRVGFQELPSYKQVMKDKTEANVVKLKDLADVVINTNRCTAEDVVVRAAAHLGLYDREYPRLVDVVIGGQYGSEGKGHIASYLSREYDVLVRVGGPNAGHKVFEEPAPYTFHHLPSGTRCTEAALVIAPGAVVNVEGLLKEISECQVDVNRLSIDPQVMIIETRDVRSEKRTLEGDIGSTAQGVGYATSRRIIGRGRKRGQNVVRLARDVPSLRPYLRESYEQFEKAFAAGKRVLLEGTQGTGLSLYHGTYPHVTSRDTTVSGCLAEAGISPGRVRKVVMVCRTYPIRVGDAPGTGETSGYMSQPTSWAEISRRSNVSIRELENRERGSTTNRKRRVAEFDWALLRKASAHNGPTDVALTFVDYIDVDNRQARRFEQLTDETIRLIEEMERIAAAPVSLISTRFHSRSIIDRRRW